MTPELACLKDGDGLDQLRIGELDLRFLRTPASRSLVTKAVSLVSATWPPRSDDQWAKVRAAALARWVWS